MASRTGVGRHRYQPARLRPKHRSARAAAAAGAARGEFGGSRLERARHRARRRPHDQHQHPTATPAALLSPTGRLDTDEEQALRREQSRQQLDKLYAPSPVEREYRARLSDPTLRQFGYDLLQAGQRGTPGTVTGSVGDTYVVGVGDDLVIQFQGATNASRTVKVDREGRIVVDSLSPIYAAGRTLGAVRRDLEAATKRTLLGTEVFVSLGSVRAITVFVGGEVGRPGQFNLTSLSDVGAALSLAGGVRRSGSLRNVRVVRGGRSIGVDLYGLIGIGTPPAVRLQDGDRIIVPVIGDTVAVAGAVARPGIYEVRRGTSVAAALEYAGGALRPRGNTLAISRISAGGQETFIRAASLSSRIEPGDAIQLVGGSAGGATGRVILRGYVENPGPRPLLATPTVADLVGPVADLRFDTYLPMAVLIRRDPETAARVFQPVNLITALRSRPAVPLRSDDRLYVFSRTDIAFLNTIPVRRIALGQPNPYPECRSLARLEALVSDTKSARFDVVTRGSFVVERAGQSDVAVGGNLKASRGDEGVRTGSDALVSQGANGSLPPPQAAAGAMPSSQTPLMLAPPTASDRSTPVYGPDGMRLSPGGESNARCPQVFEEEPELLPVLIENAVAVGGTVRSPGAYPIAGTMTARDVAAVAQGTVPNVTALTLDVSHGNTLQRIDVTNDDILATTRISAGDDLRFNGAVPQYENGGVLLTGEVARPGLYTIRRGERLSELIARAGGVSNLAYPYGAIFTRRSVKEAQQEGIRRTTRELTNAFLAVSARKNTSGTGGDSTASVGALIASLASVEAPGRVVIEADPRALAVRPDLDTVLEAGDTVYMPKRPNYVLALGDVSNPGALQFSVGKTVLDYVGETGGTSKTADKKRIFLVLPNGTAQPLRDLKNINNKVIVPPGSTIIVPKDIDPLYKLDLIRDHRGHRRDPDHLGGDRQHPRDAVGAMAFALVSAAVAAIVAALIGTAARPIGTALGLLDFPDDPGGRKLHAAVTPLVGGIAVTLVAAAAMAATIVLGPDRGVAFDRDLTRIALAVVVSFAIGVADDRFELSVRARLTIMVFVLLLVVAMVPDCMVAVVRFGTDTRMHLLGDWAIPFTLLCLVGLLNAVNMADGKNGVVIGQALVWSAFLLFHLPPTLTPVMAAIAAALAVLLAFNMRGRLFLGDGGSYAISALFGLLAIYCYNHAFADFGAEAIVLLFSVPVIDTLRLLATRLAQRRSPFAGGRDHLHHYLYARVGWPRGLAVYLALVVIPNLGAAITGGALAWLAFTVAAYAAVLVWAQRRR